MITDSGPVDTSIVIPANTSHSELGRFRLTDSIQLVDPTDGALRQGGNACKHGGRPAISLGMKASRSTLLRLIRALPNPPVGQ